MFDVPVPRLDMSASKPLPAIYAVVARIPRGRVSTYGRVAELAGLPRRARLVGRALRELPSDSDVPWYRVLNAAGKISPRGDALGHEELQAHLLEREGVHPIRGAVRLEEYLWQPRPAPKAARRTGRAQRGGGAARKAAR
jgi:methylated-DNA-protein-cysteine methyltransferase-like protein